MLSGRAELRAIAGTQADTPARREFHNTARTAQFAEIQSGCAESLTEGLLQVFEAIQLPATRTVSEPGAEAILLHMRWNPDNQYLPDPDRNIPRSDFTGMTLAPEIHRRLARAFRPERGLL